MVTTVAGRSDRTRALVAAAGVEVLESLEAVATQAEVVFSIVPPASAIENARTFAAAAERCGARPIFVDANAVSAETMRSVSAAVDPAGIRLVDMCILGSSHDLERCRIYLSGKDASTLIEMLNGALVCKLLSAPIGGASAIKMVTSGFFKGFLALFFEFAVAGAELDILKVQLEEMARLLPETMRSIEELAPTFQKHASRRVDELTEVIQTIQGCGSATTMATAARRTIERVAKSHLGPERGLEDIVAQLVASGTFKESA